MSADAASAGAGGAGAGSTPTIKLSYFNGKGRAENTRLTLVAGGVEFEDHRFSGKDEFVALKPTLPYGSVPVMEYNGQLISQSEGIFRFAGRLTGLYPTDALQGALVDQVLGGVADVTMGFAKIFFGPGTAEEKAAKVAEHAAEALPKWTGFFENLIKANGDGVWIVGDSMTIADIALFNMFDQLADKSEGKLGVNAEATPRLAKLLESVAANEKIAAYRAAASA